MISLSFLLTCTTEGEAAKWVLDAHPKLRGCDSRALLVQFDELWKQNCERWSTAEQAHKHPYHLIGDLLGVHGEELVLLLGGRMLQTVHWGQ